MTVKWDASDELSIHSITAYESDLSDIFNQPSPASALPGVFLETAEAAQYGYVTSVTPEYDIHHRQFSQELQLIGT